MADEKGIAQSEASPAEDMEVKDAPEPATEPEHNSDRDSLNNVGGVDESEAKRPRLESNGDNVVEADNLAAENGHQEEGKEEDSTTEKLAPNDDLIPKDWPPLEECLQLIFLIGSATDVHIWTALEPGCSAMMEGAAAPSLVAVVATTIGLVWEE